MDNIEQLARLVPEVAIALIFAYVVLQLNKSHALAHSEKTKAFLEESKLYRESHEVMSRTLIALVEKTTKAIEENVNVNKSLIKVIEESLRK